MHWSHGSEARGVKAVVLVVQFTPDMSAPLRNLFSVSLRLKMIDLHKMKEELGDFTELVQLQQHDDMFLHVAWSKLKRLGE
jgi:hypothetical protein